MIIYDQFGTIQYVQRALIAQTTFLVGTFFAISYSKTALVVKMPLCGQVSIFVIGLFWWVFYSVG